MLLNRFSYYFELKLYIFSNFLIYKVETNIGLKYGANQKIFTVEYLMN